MRTARYAALGICGSAFLLIGVTAATERVHRPSKQPEVFDPMLVMPRNVKEIVTRSCADCHATGTNLPWYAAVPPASWMVAEDMCKARRAVDLTHWSDRNGRTWGAAVGTLQAMCGDVNSGRMPDKKYLWMHPDAKMSPEQVKSFCSWTQDQIVQARRSNAPSNLDVQHLASSRK